MGCLQSYFRKAHNAGLSPSATNAQDGLNHNTDPNKQQQQGPVVTDDITTKVDVPLDCVPQSPASDSGAASAASSPASSPVRPPREKNKPQAVRAKLTTTGDRHPSPILQQALQAAALITENRDSKTPEETTPKSGTTSPTENSNKSNTDDINKKDDNNSRPESQSASESKTNSPIQTNEAVVTKDEVNLSTANSPDNLNKSSDKSDNSRFITTPVKEIANIFPISNDSESNEEKTENASEQVPSSPTNFDTEKTESEIKSPEADEPKSTPEETAEKPENRDDEISTSPAAVDEVAITPAVSPSNVEAAPEENQPEVVSAPQSPVLENETSASRTSKRISELGSEDFKPQTPEVLVHSPDQSTCDDVSAAVLAEDEPSAPAEQMQVVQEETAEENAEGNLVENSVAPEENILPIADEAETKPTSPVEEKQENIMEHDEQVTSGNEPEENISADILNNTLPVSIENIEPENVVIASPEIKPEESEDNIPEENVSEDKISGENVAEEKLEEPAKEPSIENNEVVDEVKPNLISVDQNLEVSEEKENAEDIKVDDVEDQPPGTPSEKLTLDGIESLDPIEPEPRSIENAADNIETAADTENINESKEEAVAAEDKINDVQLPIEILNPEENVETVPTSPVEPEELTNPETGTPVQSQTEEIVQDVETGISSVVDENCAPEVPEDKMAEFVAMSPEATEAEKQVINEENNENNIEKSVTSEAVLPEENKELETLILPSTDEATDAVGQNETEKSHEEPEESIPPEVSNTNSVLEDNIENKGTSEVNNIIQNLVGEAAESENIENIILPEENQDLNRTMQTPEIIDENVDSLVNPTEEKLPEENNEITATEENSKTPVPEKTSGSPIEQEVEKLSSLVQELPPEEENKNIETKDTDIENKIEEEISTAVEQGQDNENIDEPKLISPTPPPSPVQLLIQEENINVEVEQSTAEEVETIDEASGEIEKISIISEEIDKTENKKTDEAEDTSYPVPSTAIDFTPATPSQSPVNEEENKETDVKEVEITSEVEIISNIEIDQNIDGENIEKESTEGPAEIENAEDEKIETIENTDDTPAESNVVVNETIQQEENINNEIQTQDSINQETQNENVVETSKETGEILPVQSSTEQDTVIQVTQEEPTPSDSQSSLLGNEGLGAVSSVVIRYSLSDVNENPDESNEEGVKQEKSLVGDEEETDKTEEELLKEEQEIADTLIAAVRASEETPTETVSCENNSISGGEEIQPSISEPAEVASIQTGSSKDAESLQHDDIQKEAIIIEPIDLSALDESDKLEESMIISEVSNTDSAAEEKIEETQPTIDSTQFQIDDISIGTAVQDMVETPSSGDQLVKDALLEQNITQNEEDELEAAATKIQASFRGHQTRKSLNATDTLAQETLEPAMAAVSEEAAEATWHALPAQVVNDELDEEQLLAQTESVLAEKQKRYAEDSSSLSALEELVQTSTLIAATPLAYTDSSPPPAAVPHLNQLRTTYSSSGEAADVSASVTEPVSWNGGVSRVLDEESGELITPDDDEGVWATLEREIGETQEQELAATKIQAGFRGHKARQSLLQREDAVQIVTSSASDVSNTPFSGVRHTGEFHDSLLLPLSGETPIEQQSSRLVHDTAVEDAATNIQPIAANIQEDTDVITEPQLIVLDENVTSDFDNMSENSESFLDKAATKIQATFRGFKTRNEIKQKSPVRTPSPSDIEAATKIQAGFRGYQVRKDMKNSASPKLGRIQSAPEIRIEESEEERSATKIQAGVRGYLTRQRLKKERSPQPSPSPEPTTPEMEGAVVKLQAGFRGYKARQDVKQLREGKDVKN